MRKRLGKIIQRVVLSLLGLVLALSLWQMAARAIFHQDPPYLFGYAQLTVLSGSMEPAFSAGDFLIIHKEADYRVGDVVTFQDEGALTTHRIVEESPRGFTTKGDFNNAQDFQPVPNERILGKVVLVVPGLGQAILFLRTPAGMTAILLLGLLLLLVPEGWRRIQNRKKGGAS